MEQRDDSTSDWDFGFDFGAGPSDEQTDRGDDAPADDGPIRKGGGPPGRSAFLPGGRLRRLSRDRGPSRVPASSPEPASTSAPTAFHPTYDDAGRQVEEPVFRPVNEWVFEPDPEFSPEPFTTRLDEPTPPPSHSSPSSTTTAYDPFVPFDATAPEAPAEPAAPRPAAGRTFPGGRAKLPRLHPDSDAEAEVDYVSTAFIPGREAEDDTDRRTGFHGYNTYESLFADATIADPLTTPVDEDAYAVLGVSREDEWKVVVRAHRQLVKANHPDRLSDAPTAVRQEAEERLRQINLAYREVKEHRREEGRPTTSAESDADGLDDAV